MGTLDLDGVLIAVMFSGCVIAASILGAMMRLRDRDRVVRRYRVHRP